MNESQNLDHFEAQQRSRLAGLEDPSTGQPGSLPGLCECDGVKCSRCLNEQDRGYLDIEERKNARTGVADRRLRGKGRVVISDQSMMKLYRQCSTCGKPTFDKWHTVCAECSGIQRARVDAVAVDTLAALDERCPLCRTRLMEHDHKWLSCPVSQQMRQDDHLG